MDLKTLSPAELTAQVCVIIGTRPNLVKQGTIIRELQRQAVPFFVIHTGQHYSYELDRAFFNDLQLPEPEFRLQGVEKCKLHGEQTAEMLKQIEKVLIAQKPQIVLVGGDTNSTLAGALAARKLNLGLAHDESGLRGYKWNVPEEHNRLIIDHISDYLFVPCERTKQVLQGEGVRGQIFITGSTISDAVGENLAVAQETSTILQDLSLEPRKYLVMTLHHEENIDYRAELANLLQGVAAIGARFALPIIFPVHPRTWLRLRHFNLEGEMSANKWLKPIAPLGYLDFLALVAQAQLILTDSGGLIQEAAILRVPCLTLGTYTEWTEVVEVGANLISMNDPVRMPAYAEELVNKARSWPDLFGPPGVAKRIVAILKSFLN
jgi:UDP-N-acetylglucosamine 2-epimerase (non-hydrolysing)